uniref:ILCR1 Ig-like domain-containing protein n=1 Tax=Biomphalaria glabrata TaxID=6526 RepID=A0A2C9KT18_BIOGL
LSSNPADWVPSISTKAYASGILDVKFTLSPPEFRFTKFKVQLLKKSHSEVNYYREETYEGKYFSASEPEGRVQFTNLTSDSYRVKVQAKEEFGGLGGKCLCWKYNRNRFGPGCRQGRCCENACDGIMTAWIYVGSANSRTETVSTTTAFPTASYAINTTPATTSNQNVLAVAPSYTRDYDPAAGSRTNVSTLRSITNEARTMMMTESTFSITTNNMTAEIPRERGAVNTLTISSTSDPSKVKNNDASVTLKWLIASITVVALVTTIALILRLKRTNSITCLNTSSFALSKPALTLCVKEPLMPKYLNGPVLSPDPKESVLPPCPIESTLSPSTYEPVLSPDQNESFLPTHQYESVLTPNLNDTVLSHSLYYDPIMSHHLNDQALAITLHEQDWVELKPNPAELSTKNLYIMSADDHSYHVTVVECLVDYLE